MGRFIHFAIAAAQEAMDHSGLKIDDSNHDRVGVHIGSGIGGFDVIEREHSAMLAGGPRKISPFFIPGSIINLAAGHVSIRFGARGPNEATATACTSCSPLHRRRLPHHPARRRRRHDRRRHRGLHYPHGGRRVRRHESALYAQRRSHPRLPPFRQGPRRLRVSARAPASSSSKNSNWRQSPRSAYPRRESSVTACPPTPTT